MFSWMNPVLCVCVCVSLCDGTCCECVNHAVRVWLCWCVCKCVWVCVCVDWHSTNRHKHKHTNTPHPHTQRQQRTPHTIASSFANKAITVSFVETTTSKTSPEHISKSTRSNTQHNKTTNSKLQQNNNNKQTTTTHLKVYESVQETLVIFCLLVSPLKFHNFVWWSVRVVGSLCELSLCFVLSSCCLLSSCCGVVFVFAALVVVQVLVLVVLILFVVVIVLYLCCCCFVVSSVFVCCCSPTPYTPLHTHAHPNSTANKLTNTPKTFTNKNVQSTTHFYTQKDSHLSTHTTTTTTEQQQQQHLQQNNNNNNTYNRTTKQLQTCRNRITVRSPKSESLSGSFR